MSASNGASHIPSLSSSIIRGRWLDLLDRAYTTGQVTFAEIEPGFDAVIAAPTSPAATLRRQAERNVSAEHLRIPKMARGFRLRFDKLALYGLTLSPDYDQWLGRFRADVASGRTDIVAFVDLAYLEAALIDKIYPSEVLVDFRIPLVSFTRAGLIDSANALETAATMVFEGRSFTDAAARLAGETLSHLETYAATFWRLSRLYAALRWRIERDSFVVEIPGRATPLVFVYSDLRSHESNVLTGWHKQIETILRDAPPLSGSGAKSFAA
ncbi:MAG: hypothetical protein ACE145_12680 [Terriglobia bacterium]